MSQGAYEAGCLRDGLHRVRVISVCRHLSLKLFSFFLQGNASIDRVQGEGRKTVHAKLPVHRLRDSLPLRLRLAGAASKGQEKRFS